MLIVDDQEPFRAVARTVVALTRGFELAGEAATGEEAVDSVERLDPGVVLMDINLPGIDGFEATRRIMRDAPSTSVVLLSSYSYDDLPQEAGTCGAVGYVHKEDFGPETLTQLLDDEARGPTP